MTKPRSNDEIRADLSYAAKGPATYRRLAGDVPVLLARVLAAHAERDEALARVAKLERENAELRADLVALAVEDEPDKIADFGTLFPTAQTRLQGELFDTQQMTPLGLCPLPHEWTQEERLRLEQTLDPSDDITVAMRQVHHWRRMDSAAHPETGQR